MRKPYIKPNTKPYLDVDKIKENKEKEEKQKEDITIAMAEREKSLREAYLKMSPKEKAEWTYNKAMAEIKSFRNSLSYATKNGGGIFQFGPLTVKITMALSGGRYRIHDITAEPRISVLEEQFKLLESKSILTNKKNKETQNVK